MLTMLIIAVMGENEGEDEVVDVWSFPSLYCSELGGCPGGEMHSLSVKYLQRLAMLQFEFDHVPIKYH